MWLLQPRLSEIVFQLVRLFLLELQLCSEHVVLYNLTTSSAAKKKRGDNAFVPAS